MAKKSTILLNECYKRERRGMAANSHFAKSILHSQKKFAKILAHIKKK